LIRLFARLVIGLCGTVSCVGVLAVEAPVNLCTAGPEGVYYAVGREMAAHANPRYLKINVVETAGSMDNLIRMGRRECGAGIVQSDAFLVYEARHPERPVEISRNRFLYAEFAHLVCRRDAKIASTGDLLANPRGHRVLVGSKESGSALTWHAFTLLDRRFAELTAENLGGQDALESLVDGEAECMFFVSGLGSELGNKVNERGKDLRLVPITEETLRTAEFGSATLYEPREIPKGSYSNLEAGDVGSGVETLSVGAILIIDRQWSGRYPDGLSTLLGAVTGAMPAIIKRATAGFK
jgi:TRAP transporter TAXI family solute receptor